MPMIEATDMIMRVKMVNLREIKKDHSDLVNDFFKILPLFVGVHDHRSVPGGLLLQLEDAHSVCKHLHNVQFHLFINKNTCWGYKFFDGPFVIS